ncbi:MAG: NAD(P)H-dependent glycerol-3-phosphate dehydrogenase [Candidatus Bruticola sp.]
MSYKVAVVGSGSWGTAQALHLQKAGNEVVIWGRDAIDLESLQEGFNRRYFGNMRLCAPGEMTVEYNLNKTVQGADFVVFAVPSDAVREVAEAIKDSISPSSIIVSTAKGLEKGSLLRMSEVLSDVLGRLERIVVLSGPSFAAEVIKELPTAVTLASPVPRISSLTANLYHYKYFRAYASTDIVGVELGGVIKNVIALAAGMIDGAGMGANARAALLTRALIEIKRIVMAMGGRSDTVSGLSGLGDLLLTATGDLSRNRQVGLMLGKGQHLSKIMEDMHQVAEGVTTANSCLQLAQNLGLETPIIKETCQILSGEHNLHQAITNLLARSQKFE